MVDTAKGRDKTGRKTSATGIDEMSLRGRCDAGDQIRTRAARGKKIPS
jgi:hypothetical protein